MPYSERAYFDGDHCAHCAARDEFNRLARIEARARAAVQAERRRNGRALYRMAAA